MKKELIYQLIEKGFKDKNKYLAFLKQFSNKLKIDGYHDMAETINNIINKNTYAIFSANKPIKNSFINIIDKKSQQKIDNMISGINHNFITSILFYGEPGTGKTNFVYELGKMINKDVVSLSLSTILDHKFGESIKRFETFMKQNLNLNNIIFIDEAESIFTTRGKSNDVFEVDRLLTTMLQLMDLKRNAIIIFSSNMIKKLDKAILRRFDYAINFSEFVLDIQKSIINILQKNNWQLSKNEIENIKSCLQEIIHLKIFEIQLFIKLYSLYKLSNNSQFESIKLAKANILEGRSMRKQNE